MKKDLGIYVHIPFCARKCDYCDFTSSPATPSEQAYYLRVLMKEIRGFEALSNLYTVKTIYIGGGTPTLIDPSQIGRILTQLRDQYEVAWDAEISMECNPGTLTEEKLGVYQELGINRLSIGLQSANDEELKLLGRIHTFSDFAHSFELARKCGFNNINVDLMSGLPKQNLKKWSESLKAVTSLSPEHISAYSLAIEPGTPFYARYGSGAGQELLPSEEEDRSMYRYTLLELKDKGYQRYEISNYAKPGFECKHNLIYWTMKDYVGFGLGAASYLNSRRFSNPKDMQEYRDYARAAYTDYRYMNPQSERSAMEEFMFLGLRMIDGISEAEFETRFHVPFVRIYGTVANRFCETGYLERKDGRLRLTEKGIDVSNRILAEFLL